LGLSSDYVLCVGNVFPVKNHLTAVRAFARLASRYPIHLVIAGSRSHAYVDLVLREMARLGLADRVKLLDFVEGDDLVALMNGARLLLFPSLTEGCPVTLLESFKCGLPAVVSRRGGLEDLGRDCALLVDDPMDDAAFAAQMERLMGDPALRSDLRARVLAKARQFSWEETADRHRETYEALHRESTGARVPAQPLPSAS
jgi:glycosyltransferase involved in cell wall biosynthesis